MQRHETHRRRALLVASEVEVRRTISRYLQLHGMDVVEVGTLHEAKGCLAGSDGFDLLVTELMTKEQAEWLEWKSLVTQNPEISLLIHGRHLDEWNRTRGEIGRTAGFIGKPFTLYDFHWVLQQLL